MAIPDLLTIGLLPPGRHPATMAEVKAAFGSSNDTRIELFGKLETFVELARTFGIFRKIYLDGSFVTDKPEPGDIDSVLEMATTDLPRLIGHPRRMEIMDGFRVKATYGVHLFIQREVQLDSSKDMTVYFQGVKAAEAIDRKLAPLTRRGILVVSL